MMILYQYWLSSSSWRVRWALRIKGLEFEQLSIDLRAGAQLAPGHKARNPMGYVPAVVVDGRCLGESVAILEWLEETHPTPPLYPNDPWLRARTRQLVELVNAGTQPLQNLTVVNRHTEDKDARKAWMAHFNARGLEAFNGVVGLVDRELGRVGKFCVGDSLTAADLYLVPQLASARRFDVNVAQWPRLLAAESAALATPHANAALPENQPDAPKSR